MKLDGYPWARLNRKGAELTERKVKLEKTVTAALGVTEARAFTASPPRIVLYVFGFDSQAAAYAATPKLIAALGQAGELHHGRDSVTGGYLLIAGFPDEKPPSPEMADALIDYLSSFAGEE